MTGCHSSSLCCGQVETIYYDGMDYQPGTRAAGLTGSFINDKLIAERGGIQTERQGEAVMTMNELIKVLEMQEEILQFSHFTNADAWELGSMILLEARRRGVSVAVSIRLNNGLTVFQYCDDGMTKYNQELMRKKCNTVQLTEHSSLHLYMMGTQSEESLNQMALDPAEYIALGGAFPIRVEEVGVIGAIVVSGLGQVSDHDLLIKCIGKYLHVDEVPRIRQM